ncbi:MAG: dihydrofolate reductase family protein [Sporichthyaceae bacterium]
MSDVRRLAATGEGLDAAGRAAAYAYPADPPGGWWLRANMVSTLDGAAIAPDGLTRNISSANDRALMGTLRALSDVLIVGVGTAESEGYGPERPRSEYAALRAANGQAPAPVTAVTSAKLDLDLTGPLFAADVSPRTILLTTSSAPPDRLAAAREVADVAIVGDHTVDPAAAVAALVERGHSRLLCEGGPRLLASVLAAGVLDEMCLTLSATMLAGDAFRILAGPALPNPPRMTVGHVLSDGTDLYLRYLRTPGRTA